MAASYGIIVDQRREEHGEQEQHAGDHGGQPGPGALADAGGRLDVGRVAARRPRHHRRPRRPSRRPGSRWAFGGVPSSSSSPASAPIAVIVPIVSKKSASISVKTSSRAETTPTVSNDAEQAELAEQAEVGRRRTSSSGSAGTLRPQPVGLSSSGAIDGRSRRSPRRSIASTVVATIPIRIAPLTLRTHSETISSRPSTNTSIGQPCEAAVDAELDRDGAVGGVRDAAHEAGVDADRSTR